jgi:hypothetical protein
MIGDAVDKTVSSLDTDAELLTFSFAIMERLGGFGILVECSDIAEKLNTVGSPGISMPRV